MAIFIMGALFLPVLAILSHSPYGWFLLVCILVIWGLDKSFTLLGKNAQSQGATD